MSKKRAPLGFALIAYNAAATLPRTLASIRPFVEQIVVAVDERTTDKTAKVAKRCGADKVVPVKVSDYHECAMHGRVLVQHFAEARNESFRHLDPALDFHGWVDADDEILGGEHFAALCERCPPESAGLWMKYIYAHNKGPNGEIIPNTEFYRERVFRTHLAGQRIDWHWQHRVHEVCVARGIDAKWTLNDDIVWVHQHGAHKTEASAPRNDLCLEVEYEEDPDGARTIFYLGNSKFAQQRWDEAVAWYERLLALEDKNTYQNWQGATYLSKAYMQLGDVPSATAAAFRALDVMPNHPEPYFDLAQCYAIQGDDDKVAFWTNLARVAMAKNAKGEPAAGEATLVHRPPFFVFVNPMDYTFNSRMPIAEAHIRGGRISAALEELESAYRAMPDGRVGQRILDLRQTEARMHAANAFVQMAAVVKDPDTILRLYAGLPPEVKAFGRARDVAIPLLMAQRDERFAA